MITEMELSPYLRALNQIDELQKANKKLRDKLNMYEVKSLKIEPIEFLPWDKTRKAHKARNINFKFCSDIFTMYNDKKHIFVYAWENAIQYFPFTEQGYKTACACIETLREELVKKLIDITQLEIKK